MPTIQDTTPSASLMAVMNPAKNAGKSDVAVAQDRFMTLLADGFLKGLELGGGLTYQSKVFLNPENTQVTPSYVSFDALVGYTFGNFRLAVNGYNLSDRRFYSQVNGGRVVPAAGRSFVASLGIAF